MTSRLAQPNLGFLVLLQECSGLQPPPRREDCPARGGVRVRDRVAWLVALRTQCCAGGQWPCPDARVTLGKAFKLAVHAQSSGELGVGSMISGCSRGPDDRDFQSGRRSVVTSLVKAAVASAWPTRPSLGPGVSC